jgi:biotin carboxylase
LISLLGLKSSIYNIETRECTDGKAYIMECTPRGGGNRLAEVLKYATGVDLIKAAVLAAVGEEITEVEQKPYQGHWAEVILHSDESGQFDGLWIDNEIKEYVVEEDLWVNPGDHVEPFVAANDAIGTLVLCFPKETIMINVLENLRDHIQIKTR